MRGRAVDRCPEGTRGAAGSGIGRRWFAGQRREDAPHERRIRSATSVPATMGSMKTPARVASLCGAVLCACTVQPSAGPSTSATPTTVSTTLPASDDTSASSGETSGTAGADSTTGELLDVGVMMSGCDAIDLLFVVDNSSSMQTYQQALAAEFPSFVEAVFEEVPPGVSVHVGITTTDFDTQCGDAEATANCQTSASFEDVQMHYNPPTAGNDGGNGSQGRLFEYAGQRYFEAESTDDPAPLTDWFSAAATAAGELGCSFEMPVAAAGFATDPANDETNAGFLRDEGALLVIFFLTDEPDKSPESETVYADMILEAKAGCGGADCVFVGGLVPSCIVDVNQKLWQFMEVFREGPPFADIADVPNYGTFVGTTLAAAVAEACANIPVG